MGVMLDAACPPTCQCDQFQVNCRNADLTTFPKALPLNTRRLHLNSNGIAEINSLELNLLSDLVYLDCSHNRIAEISRLHFIGVVKLVYLDLSYNHLNRIRWTTFGPLTNLITLRLDNNQNLSEIESGAFSTNVGLREVNLSNNALLYLNTTSLRNLEGLKAIYLSGNPWECQCTIADLSEWMYENNETFPDEENTLCTLPKSMVGIPVSMALIKIFDICRTPLGYFDYLFFVIVGFAIFISGIIAASLAGTVMVFLEHHKLFKDDEEEDIKQYRSVRTTGRFTNISL
ncbi:leucine-rich repeat-containing protein 52-like [Stegostoma tigrinum]|uniref:leucine-rich repeat-containing protein 52-like n=1 Tax=Stegostoma tigrinum TaxID=3053191 RepID=UPI00202AE1F3|nr:leucine-rich repeat-containing protein 52-like [Stegostoma tigrinum]